MINTIFKVLYILLVGEEKEMLLGRDIGEFEDFVMFQFLS